MELEALLFGLEPVVAATIGLGALVLAPVIGAIDNATNNQLSESTRSAAKSGLVFAFQAYDQVQASAAQVGESLQDLIAEAKAETAHNPQSDSSPREVIIG